MGRVGKIFNGKLEGGIKFSGVFEGHETSKEIF